MKGRAARENEKNEGRKGGVPRRDGVMCTAFRMIRTRHCGFVAGDDSLEQIGENEEQREKFFRGWERRSW